MREQSNNGKLIGNYTIALSNGTIVDPLRPSLQLKIRVLYAPKTREWSDTLHIRF